MTSDYFSSCTKYESLKDLRETYLKITETSFVDKYKYMDEDAPHDVALFTRLTN